MTDLATLRETYDRLQVPGWAKPRLDLVRVNVQRQPLGMDQAAFEMVTKALVADAAQGWARLRSAVVASGDPFPDFAVAGPPLAAEWRVSETRSVHLRQAPTGTGLVQWTYAEGDGPSAITVLRQESVLVRHPGVDGDRPPSRGSAQDVLVYHVFWGATADDPGALRSLFHRFVGFDRRPCITWPNR